MESSYNIKFDIEKYTNLRHHLHQIPEFSYKEFKTKTLLLETIQKLPNFSTHSKITYVGDTGFFIDIQGTAPPSKENKQFISLRTDLDALPFVEETDLPYKSTHPGMIHGCGHDGHMAVLTATLDYYLANINKIPSNFGVRFLYQPAEEGYKGAIKMIEGGCLDDITEIFGLHNVTTFNIGEIGVIPGTIMARIDSFNIKIKGKGGHGSTPFKCHSPINAGVQIVEAINRISSQEVDSTKRHAISIGCFNSGEAMNVIPENGIIKGTVRSLENNVGIMIINRIKEISESMCKLNGCELEFETDSVGSCTSNHSEQAEFVRQVASDYFKVETHDLPLMASEDFSYYLDNKPGCFFMLGVKDEGHKEYLHTPVYDFNDKGLPYGVEMFVRIIERKSGVKLI